MKQSTLASEKAAQLKAWFDTGGSGEFSIPPNSPDTVKYWVSDGPVDFRGAFTLHDFIGGLIYHDALRIEQETGYSVDASMLAERVLTEFVNLRNEAQMRFEFCSKCPIKQIQSGHRVGAFLLRDFERGKINYEEVRTRDSTQEVPNITVCEGLLIDKCVAKISNNLCHPAYSDSCF